MTRINAGIDPSELSDKHLIAEHREIKRIPNLLAKGKLWKDRDPKRIPEKFTLGKGHVLFFANKMGFLWHRYITLNLECKVRKFNVTNFNSCFAQLLDQDIFWEEEWYPDDKDIEIIKQRIKERTKT